MSYDLKTAQTWDLQSLLSGTTNGGVLTLDLFKLISNKSEEIGGMLGILAYMYYYDRRLSVGIDRSWIIAMSIMGTEYFGMNKLISISSSPFIGGYIANKFYLPSYFQFDTSEMMYLSGASIIGSYLFKYLYDTFIYKPDTTATTA